MGITVSSGPSLLFWTSKTPDIRKINWVTRENANGNPILKITDSAEDLVDVLDQAIEREQRLLNQENKKLGNDSTTWMNEQAGWNKGLNKDLAVNALKNENKKINEQLQKNNSDFRNGFLGYLKNYKVFQSQLEKAITEGASNVNEAYAQVQEQNKNIINGLMADFADDNGFKNLENKLQTILENDNFKITLPQCITRLEIMYVNLNLSTFNSTNILLQKLIL